MRDPGVRTLALADAAIELAASEHPELWDRHWVSVMPCLYPAPTSSSNSLYPSIGWDTSSTGRLQGKDTSPPGTGILQCPLGRSATIGGGSSEFSWPVISVSVQGGMKFAPPLTLSMVVMIPSASQGDTLLFFTSDHKGGALANYSGVRIFLDDDAGASGFLNISFAGNVSNAWDPWISGSSVGKWVTAYGNTPIYYDYWNHIILTCPDDGTGALIADTRVWIDGAKDALGTSSGGDETLAFLNNPRSSIGQENQSFLPGTLGYSYLASWQMWKRALSDNECELLSDDPLAMFRRRRRIFGRPAEAVAGRFVSIGGHWKQDTRIVLIG
jgi:hypothetical protein